MAIAPDFSLILVTAAAARGWQDHRRHRSAHSEPRRRLAAPGALIRAAATGEQDSEQ
jgi:hypothetical protein